MAAKQSLFVLQRFIPCLFKKSSCHIAVALILALSACSHLALQEDTNLKTLAQLEKLEHWTIQGKLAIRSGDSAYNLRAHWQQRKQNFTLRLSGPLGWKPITITSNNNGVISIQRSGSLSSYKSIEALAAAVPELADWGNYLTAMPHWLKGIPYSNYPIDNVSPDNVKPSFVEQQGWRIEYWRFTQIDGFQLPTKISMARGTTQAKIIVNQWQLSATDNE